MKLKFTYIYLQQVTYTFLTLFGEEMKNITYDGFISKFVTTRFLFYCKNYFFSFTETAFGSNFKFLYKRGIFPSKISLHNFFHLKNEKEILMNYVAVHSVIWYAEPWKSLFAKLNFCTKLILFYSWHFFSKLFLDLFL